MSARTRPSPSHYTPSIERVGLAARALAPTYVDRFDELGARGYVVVVEGQRLLVVVAVLVVHLQERTLHIHIHIHIHSIDTLVNVRQTYEPRACGLDVPAERTRRPAFAWESTCRCGPGGPSTWSVMNVHTSAHGLEILIITNSGGAEASEECTHLVEGKDQVNIGEHDLDVLLLYQIRIGHRQSVQRPLVVLQIKIKEE